VYKCTGNLLTLYGLIEAGSVETGDKVFVMPQATPCTVKGILSRFISLLSFSFLALAQSDSSTNIQQVYFAGDQVVLTLSGVFESDSVYPGNVICQGGSDLLVPTKHFVVKLILFEDALPILKVRVKGKF
jgi:translation elongation factor EF-1alpha